MISHPAAEIILRNGCIFAPPSLRPAPQALAITGGRIIAVGRDRDVIALAGPGTEIIDLAGRLVLPGFFDAHIHFYEWAMKRRDLQLGGLSCREELLQAVANAAAQRQPDRWLMGQGWNETDWSRPLMPDRKALDRAAPKHPVLLWRCDLHLAAANSAALNLAGINRHTPDPPDGLIERDATGRPTGILRELAINLVRRVITPPAEAEVEQAFVEAAAALHRRGITAIHDVRLMADTDGAACLRAFQELDRSDRLMLRSWVSLPGERLEEIIALGLRSGFGSDRLRLGAVKFFADGGMGARTAWLIEPYLDGGSGIALMDMARLAEEIAAADDAGLSVMVHAVGDRANREVIGLFEALEARRSQKGTAAPAMPHRIEHVQMIRPQDALRLAPLNLALCVTPPNMILDINLIDTILGKSGEFTYDFRRLIDTGRPVMFSSDCPVCDPAPLPALHAAITRQRPDGSPAGGWHAASRLTAAEALQAYTMVPAAVHQAPELGMIAPGRRADLAVLSENILPLPPERLLETTVDLTLFDGRIVHRCF